MFDKYLVTGATGFLGLAVVRELVRRGETVRALVLEGDPCAELLPREQNGMGRREHHTVLFFERK